MSSDVDNLGEPARVEGKWEMIGPPDCPLMFRRTLLAGRLGKLLVHRFMPGATDKDPHDHPRPFLTIVLRGGYEDVSSHSDATIRVIDRVRAPTIRYRSAAHAHITEVHDDGALSVVLMGPLVRDWGFWRDGRWWPWRLYERRYGLGFRCEDE